MGVHGTNRAADLRVGDISTGHCSVRVDGMPVDWDGCRKCAHINLRRDLVSGEMRLGGGDERITRLRAACPSDGSVLERSSQS